VVRRKRTPAEVHDARIRRDPARGDLIRVDCRSRSGRASRAPALLGAQRSAESTRTPPNDFVTQSADEWASYRRASVSQHFGAPATTDVGA
jgi:hypothetical protein